MWVHLSVFIWYTDYYIILQCHFNYRSQVMLKSWLLLGRLAAKKYKNKHPWPEGTGGTEKYRDELLYSWYFESRFLLAPVGSQNRCRYGGDEEGNSKIHPCQESSTGPVARRAYYYGSHFLKVRTYFFDRVIALFESRTDYWWRIFCPLSN